VIPFGASISGCPDGDLGGGSLVQALYRRWRPQSFDDVIGQDPVTRTLQNALDDGRLGHAYLFTGPRGTGKTSVARILAKAVNCTGEPPRPCNACPTCVAITAGRLLDLVEIDAASNTGVDDVRDLRDKVNFAPNEARYKVYIVDEVHMLSTAAFNALLKTLEEPPGHVIFILATTEPQKIPETIISRCQKHDFRRVPIAAVVAKLERICEAESVSADRAALEMVARSATGSMRDAESLMDMLLSTGERVTAEQVETVLGTAGGDAIDGIVHAVIAGDTAEGLRHIHSALERGADPRQVRSQVLDLLRSLLLLRSGLDGDLLSTTPERLLTLQAMATEVVPADLASALRHFNDAKPAAEGTHPGLPLELALVETVLAAGRTAAGSVAAPGRAAQVPAAAAPAAAGRAGAGPTAKAGLTAETPTSAAESRSTYGSAPSVPAEPKSTSEQPAAEPTPAWPKSGAKRGAGVPEPAAESPAGEAPTEATSSDTETAAALIAQWDEVLENVARDDRNLSALLKDGKPLHIDSEAITLGFFYEFHCRRVAEPTRADKVRRAIFDVTGMDRSLRCTVIEPTPEERRDRPSNKTEQAHTDPLVRHAVDSLGARISDIKPGGE
jgi:DNA polymerase III subunit gamma/tau